MGEMMDTVLSRRESWVGAVLQMRHIPRTDPYYNHYVRCTISERDDETGEWWISWREGDYIGPTAPPGEPVYVYNGTTWDLPTTVAGAFPLVHFLLSIAASALAYPAAVYLIDSPDTAGYFLFCIWVCFFGAWYYRVEPVRGTKAAAIATAANIASQMHARAVAEQSNAERMDHWNRAKQTFIDRNGYDPMVGPPIQQYPGLDQAGFIFPKEQR